jgi:AraC family transcriptional regulator, transcriptional activator of pobA
MAEVLELKTFYKNLQKPEPIENEAGHFNIFKVEDLMLTRHKKLTYSRRAFFKISLVTGHSNIHYADKCFEVDGSVLVFTNPMVPYQWEVISPEQSGYICIFTEAFCSRFGNVKAYPIFQQSENGVIYLNGDDEITFKALFLNMLEELQSNYAYKYDLIRNLLMELIHRAQKLRPAQGIAPSPSNASERIAGIFAELLERQFPIEMAGQKIVIHTPSAFASQLNIHVNHLNKALKEITGKTTSQLINERLLQEAKILLKSTNWTITEIAWSLGFEEANHFSSFFKTRAGITPNNFRQIKID